MEIRFIQKRIFELRGQKVIFDFDLAAMYEVENRVLKQAVKRNIDRFPDDFMFQLSIKEWQEVITNCDKLLPAKVKFSPATPFAFTEQGIAMLSSVLKSKKAIEINMGIMRTFVFIRQYSLSHDDLTRQLKELESRYNIQFRDVYEAINYLLKKDKVVVEFKRRKRIGFQTSKNR